MPILLLLLFATDAFATNRLLGVIVSTIPENSLAVVGRTHDEDEYEDEQWQDEDGVPQFGYGYGYRLLPPSESKPEPFAKVYREGSTYGDCLIVHISYRIVYMLSGDRLLRAMVGDDPGCVRY